MSLNTIIEPINGKFSDFDKFYKEHFNTKVAFLSKIISYMSKASGKRLRPALVFLTAEMLGGFSERAYTGATLIEMLHNATLVHDDVVDEADQRRGIASINAVWNNKTAVLVGDYFLAKGLTAAIDRNEFDFLSVISKTVKRMSEGELLSLERSKSLKINEEIYFEITSNKTASLLASCTEIGAISANANAETRQKLAKYGELMGIAFQVRDDILDFIAKTSILGKPTGLDIEERKITLPLIYALDNANPSEVKKVRKILKSDTIIKSETKFVVDFTIQNGGIDYAQAKAEDFANQAKVEIAEFEENIYKQSLIALADFVHTRKK